MHVHGEYESEEDTPLITFAYSKDQRSDLKQFMIYLMNSQDGDVPLLAQTGAGNSSDKKLFRENLQALKKEIEQGEEGYFIADSALYTKETIGDLSSHLKWITRVTETNREAKALLNSSLEMVPLEEGYSGIEITSQYGETPQRWLVVDSAKAKEKTLRNRINKEYVTQSKEGKKFQKQQFSCEEDAKRVLQEWSKKLRYHQLIDTEILIKKSKKGRGRHSGSKLPSTSKNC